MELSPTGLPRVSTMTGRSHYEFHRKHSHTVSGGYRTQPSLPRPRVIKEGGALIKDARK